MTPSAISCPGHLPASTCAAWQALDVPTVAPDERVDPSLIDRLPAPVRRWLHHSIDAERPAYLGVRLSMHGEIKVGKWRPFTACQIIAPGGFIWAADAGRFPMRIRGFDRYTDGSGELRWKLFGLIPAVSADGPDTTRSAAGRLAGETVLTPGAMLTERVTWAPVDDHQATATIADGLFTHQVTIRVDDAGTLRSASLPRWGDPDDQAYREHRFGVDARGERTFAGTTLPAKLSAGWWHGTDRWADGEFFRCTIDEAEFF